MKKLNNIVQHYAWGSVVALTERYHIANPTHQPIAEMWMGAHPQGSSTLFDDEGKRRTLREQIAENPVALLGERIAHRFGELPFLFKVLCAEQPLSIQVHPAKKAAERGFARENEAGLAPDAPQRNYKDANHKPELVYALTPFLALNGFRELSEIADLLRPLAGLHAAIDAFLLAPDSDTLASLFAQLLQLEGEAQSEALLKLKAHCLQTPQQAPWSTVLLLARFWPHDNGLFAPLLLNVIELRPGDSMFLGAQTPHAYLQGMALEVMANSDNVLRAGLTAKHIDVDELLANVRFTSRPARQLLTTPLTEGPTTYFPVPVDDFAFSIHTLSETPYTITQDSAAILFCMEGEAILENGGQPCHLIAGESVFVAASEPPVTLQGEGKIARVYND